jgi:hypothetical protein
MVDRLPIILDDGRLRELPTDQHLDSRVLESLIDDLVVGPDHVFSSQKIMDLLMPFAITSFTATPASVELGTTLPSITLNWATNTTPDSVTLSNGIGAIVPATQTSYVHGSQSLTTTRTYTLTAIRGGISKNANASVTFMNQIYYGVHTSQSIDPLVIKAMTKTLSNTRGRTITYDCTGGRYFHLAIPTRLGIPTFRINGLTYSDMTINTVDIPNALGYNESYYVWYCNIIQFGGAIPLVVT